MPKQLTLQEVPGQDHAVDGQKGLRLARTPGVDGVRKEFFACAAFPSSKTVAELRATRCASASASCMAGLCPRPGDSAGPQRP